MEAVNSDHSALEQSDVKQGSASMLAESNEINRKSYDINRMDIYIEDACGGSSPPPFRGSRA